MQARKLLATDGILLSLRHPVGMRIAKMNFTVLVVSVVSEEGDVPIFSAFETGCSFRITTGALFGSAKLR